MKHRKLSSEEKFNIVVEGLKGKSSIAELCNRHAIAQSQYYQWRDKFFSEGSKLFSYGGASKETDRLKQENEELKALVGEFAVELKKRREVFG